LVCKIQDWLEDIFEISSCLYGNLGTDSGGLSGFLEKKCFSGHLPFFFLLSLHYLMIGWMDPSKLGLILGGL